MRILYMLLGTALLSCTGGQPAVKEFVNITPEELCELVSKNKDVVFLDVRSEEEFKGSVQPYYHFGKHFRGAINIPLHQLESRLDELHDYKNRQIVVNCAHSNRSPRASRLLVDNGFTNVKNLLGGLSKWEHADADVIPCKDAILVNER